MSNEELNKVLMDEVTDAEKGLRRLKIGGGLLIAFLLVYLQLIFGQFAVMAEPDGLADIGVFMLEENAADVVTSIEAGLSHSASTNVQAFYDGMVNGVAVVRVGMMDNIRAADSALARQMEAWLGDYFDKFVKENPQLQLIAEKKADIAKDAFAGLSDHVRADLELMFEAGGLDKELGEATAMISGFADRLERYTSGIGLGHDEREERDLIHAWVNLVAPDFEAPTEDIEAR
jgi:hypothetical protein